MSHCRMMSLRKVEAPWKVIGAHKWACVHWEIQSSSSTKKRNAKKDYDHFTSSMSQREEKETPLTGKFSKECFVVKALLASEEKAKSTEKECKLESTVEKTGRENDWGLVVFGGENDSNHDLSAAQEFKR